MNHYFIFPVMAAVVFSLKKTKQTKKIPKKINQVLEFDCKKKSKYADFAPEY